MAMTRYQMKFSAVALFVFAFGFVGRMSAQEIDYRNGAPGVSQPHAFIDSSLQDDTHYLSIGIVNQAAASARPCCLINYVIEADLALLNRLATCNMAFRCNRERVFKRETSECYCGT